MTVVINGTTGITDVNGSASAPAITGVTTNTGMFFGTNTVGVSTNGTTALSIDASQNTTLAGTLTLGTATQSVPSGSAPLYASRAWVNFNGTGTVAIRGSGNVTSITDNGTGDYTVNFTTAITDVNYAVNITTSIQGTTSTNGGFMSTLNRNTTPAVGSVRIEMFTSTFGNADSLQVNVTIFR